MPGNKPAEPQFISVSALHPHWSNSSRLNGVLALRDLNFRAQSIHQTEGTELTCVNSPNPLLVIPAETPPCSALPFLSIVVLYKRLPLKKGRR